MLALINPFCESDNACSPMKSEDRQRLEAEFEQAMLDIYPAVRKRTRGQYRPGYLLDMLHRLCGVGVAKAMLSTSEPQPGFIALWEHGCLGLSVEALVLKPQYRVLFNCAELLEAQKRLLAHRYDDFDAVHGG